MNEGINPAFDLIGLTQLRNDPQFEGIDGSGFSVAVIDSGINYNHELLAPNYLYGDDYVDDDSDPLDDEIGHGTHVAGTVGAADEAIGVAPGVGIIALDVFPSDVSLGAPLYSTEAALQWVVDNHEQYGIVAVNMSVGQGGSYTSEDSVEPAFDDEKKIIEDLEREGIVVVSSAGNDYDVYQTLGVHSPAIFSTLAL